MSLLSILVADKLRRKRLAGASAQLPGLLGGAVTTQGSMRSAEEFDEFGNPIFGQETLQDPRREGYGFLGSDRGPGAEMDLLGGMLSAGFNPNEAATITGPYFAQQKQAQAAKLKQAQRAGQFKDMNTYASQLTSLSSDAQKALAPFDQAMLGYKQISNLYKQNAREGGAIKDLEGPFDLALQRNFIKSLAVLRPEAYMQDDAVQAMMAAQNIGDFAQLKNWLTGDIKLNEKGRKRMLKAYDSVMKDNYEVMQQRRDPYEKQAELLFPETPQETIFGDSPAEYEEGLFDYTPGAEEAMSAPGEVRTTPSGMKYKVLK